MRRKWRRRRARAGLLGRAAGRAGRGGGHEVKVYLGAHLARSEGRAAPCGVTDIPPPPTQPSTCRLKPSRSVSLPSFRFSPASIVSLPNSRLSCPSASLPLLPLPALEGLPCSPSPAPRRTCLPLLSAFARKLPAVLPVPAAPSPRSSHSLSATRGFRAQDFAAFLVLSCLGGFPQLLASVFPRVCFYA